MATFARGPSLQAAGEAFAAALIGFAEDELSCCGATFVVGLNQEGRVGQGRFFYFYFDFRGSPGVGYRLCIERSRSRPRKTEGQASTSCGCASLGDLQLHRQVAIRVNGLGIKPMNIEFFDRGEGLRLLTVQCLIQLAFSNRVENETVLLAELLLFLRVAEDVRRFVRVRSGFLADAASADKHLRLQQTLAFTCFTLHVVDGVTMLDVGIEAENHRELGNLVIL